MYNSNIKRYNLIDNLQKISKKNFFLHNITDYRFINILQYINTFYY